MTELSSTVPEALRSGPVRLSFVRLITPVGNPELVPYYRFWIVNEDEKDVGHVNLRVGETRHVTMFAGHVGYGIQPDYRGHSYSYHACRALAPFVRKHFDEVILTVETGNGASLRIIEKLGATFIEEVEVPPEDPAYRGGARRKLRYRWIP